MLTQFFLLEIICVCKLIRVVNSCSFVESESWFGARVAQDKLNFFDGDDITCVTKTQAGVPIPSDLGLKASIAANEYINVDPTIHSKAKIIKGPGKTNVTCIMRASRYEFKAEVEITVRGKLISAKLISAFE